MTKIPFERRVDLANQIHAWRAEVSEEAAVLWTPRLSNGRVQARIQTAKDIRFHLAALAGAVEGGSIQAFEDHVRWTVRMRGALGDAPGFVAEMLGLLGDALSQRLSFEASGWVSTFLAAGSGVCGEDCVRGVPREQNRERDRDLGRVRSRFMEAILRGRRSDARKLAIAAVDQGIPLIDIYEEVLQGSLYDIGLMWENNQITVAQEHTATALTQDVVARIYSRLEIAAPHRGKMVVCGPMGESHQLGANMVADLFEAEGWDVRFLGTGIPNSRILRAVEEHKADVLGISSTLLLSIPEVVRLVDKVHRHFGEKRPKILLGGRAFKGLGHLASELGVVGIAPDFRQGRTLLEG